MLAGCRLEDNENDAMVLMPGRARGVETVGGVWLAEGTPTVARKPGNSFEELADVFLDNGVDVLCSSEDCLGESCSAFARESRILFSAVWPVGASCVGVESS